MLLFYLEKYIFFIFSSLFLLINTKTTMEYNQILKWKHRDNSILNRTCHTLLCRFINCKLAVQSKLGPQRLSQLGYSNVIFLTPRKNKGHYYTGFGIFKFSRFLGFQETPYKSMQSNIMENLILYFFLKFWEMSAF